MVTHEVILVGAFIFFYSVIQSVFGVGFLLFGTPTLLLLGFTFHETLSYLLPCSIAINVMQLIGQWKVATQKRNFLIFCLPIVGLSLAVVLMFEYSINIKLYVGIFMILTAALRGVPILMQAVAAYCRRHIRLSFIILGGIHGFTNMGGGLLSILMSSLYSEKNKIRSNIAFSYLLMASCQLAVITLMGHQIIGRHVVVFMATALASYFFIGNRIYLASTEASYQKTLTVFIFILGLTLLFI